MLKKYILNIIVLFAAANLSARQVSFQGQLSGWLSHSDASTDRTTIGLRYIPWLIVSEPARGDSLLDFELAAKAYTSAPPDKPGEAGDNSELKFYRLSARYSSKQFETRIGLQKINFGPAKTLRSLMWFDSLDPRDPLKITDGVWALLTRLYFLDNSNIWLWGIKGDGNAKGLETAGSDKDKPELGGRYQFPVPSGEAALSFNRRYLDSAGWASNPLTSVIAASIADGLENRIALDGSFDLGAGLWFETVFSEIRIDAGSSLWNDSATLGIDYTFKPGIIFTLENFIQLSGTARDKLSEAGKYSALSLNYSFSVIDSITAIGYYDWLQGKTAAYAGLQRTYDDWLLNLMFFAGPDSGTAPLSGNGIQIMATYNH